MSAKPVLVEPLPQHRFDEARLDRYLTDHVAGYRGAPVVRQFQGGQSDPTFLIETPAASYVLGKSLPASCWRPPTWSSGNTRCRRRWRARPCRSRPCSCYARTGASSAPPSTSWAMWRGKSSRPRSSRPLPGAARGYLPLADRDACGAPSDRLARGGSWRVQAARRFAARQIDRWTRQYAASKTDDIKEMEQLSAWLVAHLRQTPLPPSCMATTAWATRSSIRASRALRPCSIGSLRPSAIRSPISPICAWPTACPPAVRA